MNRWNKTCCFGFSLLLCLGGAIHAAAQIRLPTLKEATELSQKTGAPILAMAGRET